MTTSEKKKEIQSKLDNGYKVYNAIESGEKFIIIAKDEADAHLQASIWNAQVVGLAKKYKP